VVLVRAKASILRIVLLLLISALMLPIIIAPPTFGKGESIMVSTSVSSYPLLESDPAVGDSFVAWKSAPDRLPSRVYYRSFEGGPQQGIAPEFSGNQAAPTANENTVAWIQKQNFENLPAIRTLPDGEPLILDDEPVLLETGMTLFKDELAAWVVEGSGNVVVKELYASPDVPSDWKRMELERTSEFEVVSIALSGNMVYWTEVGETKSLLRAASLPDGDPFELSSTEGIFPAIAADDSHLAVLESLGDKTHVWLSDVGHDVIAAWKSKDQIVTAESFLGPPALEGDFALWTWADDTGGGANGFHIPSGTTFKLTQGTGTVGSVATNGSVVAWLSGSTPAADELGDLDIMATKLEVESDRSGSIRMAGISEVSTEQPGPMSHFTPHMDDEYLVWTDNRTFDRGVYGRRLSDGEFFTVSDETFIFSSWPQVEWPYVVWLALENEPPTLSLRNMDTKKVWSLGDNVITNSGIQMRGNHLVWVELIEDVPQVVISELDPKKDGPSPYLLASETPEIEQSSPSLFDEMLVWFERPYGTSQNGTIMAMDLVSNKVTTHVADIADVEDVRPIATELGVMWTQDWKTGFATVMFRGWNEKLARVLVVNEASPTAVGVYDNKAIWLSRSPSTDDASIKAMDLTTGDQTELLRVSWPISKVFHRDGLLVMEDRRIGERRIFMLPLGDNEIPKGLLNLPQPDLDLAPIKFSFDANEYVTPTQNKGPGCGLVGSEYTPTQR